MVALKLTDGNNAVDYRRTYGDIDSDHNKVQKLKLVDVAKKAKAERTRRRDNFWLNIAIASVVIYFACVFCNSVWHQIQASSATITAANPIVKVTVKPGDTLWQYAVRYGAPDRYILDRVEAIARDNQISADSSLAPGQHLRIQVTNPVLIAKMEQHNATHMAALPR